MDRLPGCPCPSASFPLPLAPFQAPLYWSGLSSASIDNRVVEKWHEDPRTVRLAPLSQFPQPEGARSSLRGGHRTGRGNDQREASVGSPDTPLGSLTFYHSLSKTGDAGCFIVGSDRESIVIPWYYMPRWCSPGDLHT